MMLKTQGRRPFRLVVLASLALNGEALHKAQDQTWRVVLDDLEPGDMVDLFWGMDSAWSWDHQDGPPGCRVVHHPATASIVEALTRLAPDARSDIAWIEAGMQMGRGWRMALQDSLADDAAIGTVSPLSLWDDWFSPFSTPFRAQGAQQGPGLALRVEALRRWLIEQGPTRPLEVGWALGSVGVLRAEAVIDLLDGPPPADPLGHLGQRGWIHAVNARVLGWNTFQKASHHPQSTLMAAADAWANAHPLTALRHAAQQAWQRLESAPDTAESPSPAGAPRPPEPKPHRTPVRLHISHSWGGGLAKWVHDFGQADPDVTGGVNLVLRSVGVFGAFGQRLVLHSAGNEDLPIRFWELSVPIHATAIAHLQVRRILDEIIEDFGVEHILVSSLIGHSLDVLRTGLPTLIVAHDHYPFCVAIYAAFNGECRQCPQDRLSRCVSENPEHRFFKGVSPDDWLALRRSYIESVTAHRLIIVSPSRSVCSRWRSLMPELQPSQLRLIEHGLNLPPARAFSPLPAARFRVVIIGRLSIEKGEALLRQALPDIIGFCDLILLGCGETLHPCFVHPKITVIPHYDNSTLIEELPTLAPHVGLLMSTVPETFSYTLSELWHCGIPVVATNIGALGDRIAVNRDGWLVEPDAGAIAAQLRDLHDNLHELDEVRRHLQQRASRSVADMVGDYDRLLPRRMHRAQDGASPHAGLEAVLEIDRITQPKTGPRPFYAHPEMTWKQVFKGFLAYTIQKARSSPRLPKWVRKMFFN